MPYDDVPPNLRLPADVALFIAEASHEMGAHLFNAFRLRLRHRNERANVTLRPGKDTPLWNALRAQLRPHLKRYGSQAHLGRALGLPRQRINAYITQGTQMPDAERTLQLLAWLKGVRKGHFQTCAVAPVVFHPLPVAGCRKGPASHV